MAEYAADMIVSNSAELDSSLLADRFFAKLADVAKNSVFASLSENRKDEFTVSAEDLEDVRQSCQGDSEAYRRLIERHQEQVGRILWRFSRDQQVHEELVQEVFVQAYLSLRDYRGEAPFANWLARIATRVGYRYWKHNRRRQKAESLPLEQWSQTGGQTPEHSDASQAAELVHNLMAQLPPRDRLVLTLRYLEGCSVAETAHRTGWTKTMVKVQTLRARKKLEKIFRQIGGQIT
jgi:RNA polymerase sigma-70 factor (ECF subfamily)